MRFGFYFDSLLARGGHQLAHAGQGILGIVMLRLAIGGEGGYMPPEVGPAVRPMLVLKSAKV